MTRLVMDPKWRIIALSLMGITLVFLVLATMTTGWRVDEESRMNVLTTHGLWRICRDIKFGATLDHKCLSELANEAPSWFQAVRAFMLFSILFAFIAFAHGVYLIATIPVLKTINASPPSISLGFPTIFMFLAAICALVGVATYAVATAMDQALYFPEDLPPTWGNSWAEVWAKLNSLPSDRPEEKEIVKTYGYSFAIGWLGVLSTTASFIVNVVASGRS